jgi:hypothetical protein
MILTLHKYINTFKFSLNVLSRGLLLEQVTQTPRLVLETRLVLEVLRQTRKYLSRKDNRKKSSVNTLTTIR